MRVPVLTICAGVALSVSLWAQREAAEVVAVRLVATDAKGRAVALAAGDVSITVGARPQPLVSFARVADVPRHIGFLLDEYHVSPGEPLDRARSALREFVATELRGDDRVFVMKPLDTPGLLAPVGGRALEDVVTTFAGRKGDYTPRTPFEAELMSSVPPAAARQRAQVTRAAMQALIMALGRQDGPKAMIVVTEGFAQDERGRERFVSLRAIAHAARTSNVPVYVLDPSPVVQEKPMLGDAWRALALETGGMLVEAATPLGPALARVAADTSDHYVATIPAPAKEDGSYHEVKVGVNKPGVAVRAPRGFWAKIAAERYAPASRPAMSTYLKTPHVSGAIQPVFRMAPAPGGRTQVTVSWMPRGRTARAANVQLSAITFEGVRLHDARLAPHTADGDARAVFTAPPGVIQVALEITDAAGKVIDTEVRYLDVPKLDGDAPFIAAIELVRARSLPEFARLQTQPDALPADAREFRRQDRLLVRVRAFPVRTPVTVTLLNRLGRPMRDLQALPDAGDVPQFDLPLAPYAAGDYRLQIIAGSGPGAVRQVVTFRLIG